MRPRKRMRPRLSDLQEIADRLRRLGCTEEQITRHLLPLIHKRATFAVRHEHAEPAPVLPTAIEALADYSLSRRHGLTDGADRRTQHSERRACVSSESPSRF